VSFVDRLKTTMAALLLVLWIPATSLCLLEAAGWISDADGCAAGQSLESSPCCALASATYKIQENRQVAQPSYAVEIALVVELPKLISAPNHSALGEIGVSPLELVKTWQFCSRAASTPRAPSFAS
jgi:hypothetical protein